MPHNSQSAVKNLEFPSDFLSKNENPPLVAASGGDVRLLRQSTTLIFPELGSRRMDYRLQSHFEILRPTRFIVRSGHWTGTGVQGYPWMYAVFQGRRLSARVHGRAFWEGDHRAYMIDLGEELPVAARLDLVTQSLFVDEVGTFKPYLAFRARGELEEISLCAAFREPPAAANYAHMPVGSAVEGPWSLVPSVDRFGHRAFEFQVRPCPPGWHCLFW